MITDPRKIKIFVAVLFLAVFVIYLQIRFREHAVEPAPIATTTTAVLREKVLIDRVFITPLEILEDSRCPTDVNCIQAGTVKIRAQLEYGGVAHIEDLTPLTKVPIAKRFVILTKVTPAPTSKVKISPSDYRFEFTVGRGK